MDFPQLLMVTHTWSPSALEGGRTAGAGAHKDSTREVEVVAMGAVPGLLPQQIIQGKGPRPLPSAVSQPPLPRSPSSPSIG